MKKVKRLESGQTKIEYSMDSRNRWIIEILKKSLLNSDIKINGQDIVKSFRIRKTKSEA